jgi:3-hydroxyisobutyrate dehydrogenase-like beta-hydroxyacid dehydrogenase
MRIGFIGLGNLGQAICTRLASQNIELTIYNRNKERIKDLPYEKANTPKELLTNCEVIFLCLFDSIAVENILTGVDGLLCDELKGKTIIDLTTNHYDDVLKFHEMVNNIGANYLENPVFGSVAPALKGELTVVSSGKVEVFEAVKPILEKIAREIFHLPVPSSATKMKLINNLCLGSFMATLAECTVLAENCAIPKAKALEILGFGGQGTSPMVGNPDLKPEKSISKEVAVYYEHPNKHNFNVTLFQNNFKDKIDTGTATQSAGAEWESINSDYGEIKQKQNVGKAEILGLEASAKFYILDSLSIKGNWTWMDSKINSDKADTNGRPLQDSPEHMYSTTLDWQATSKLNTYIQYSGEINRFNQRYETTGSSNDADKRYKDSYYKDYSIVNLGASYKFTKDFTLTGRVNNLSLRMYI